MTSNPLDDLRQINREQREAISPPGLTALREDGSAEVRKPLIKELSTEAIPSPRKAARPSARKPSLTSARTAGRKEGSDEGSKSAQKRANPQVSTPAFPEALPDLRAQIQAVVGERRIYQGGVKATLDLAPELSTRFKRYSIDHHNVTLRQLMTELLDAYLRGEGY